MRTGGKPDFESIKQAKDIMLEGISADVERRDGNAVALTLTDAKGNVLRVGASDWRAPTATRRAS